VVTRLVERLGVAFGGRPGVVVFLLALCFHAATWRAGVFITDTYTLANGLVAVSEGQFAVTRIVYGPPSGVTPGMHYVDGELYARNYGQLVLALPFLWLLDGLGAVADLRVALSAGWSLCLLAVALQVGQLLGRRRVAVVAGSVAALGLFARNLALASGLAVPGHHLLALQLQTMVAAGLTAVVVYRLVERVATQRLGLAAGVAVALASPVGFWATYPKRHALVALFVVCIADALHRHRKTGDVRYRGAAYGAVGLAAWVHAGEALVLLVAVGLVDVATTRRNDPRALAVVAGVLALSLVPMLLTNLLVSGTPLTPPRLLSPYDGNRPLDSLVLLPALLGVAGAVPVLTADLGPVGRLLDLIVEGLAVSVTDPERLYRVFVRSGYIPAVAAEDGGQAISLSLLESMPLAGALLGVPALLVRRVRGRGMGVGTGRRMRAHLASPDGTVDAFAVAVLVLLSLLYLPRLPIHATVTVRYLVPGVPLLAYLVARLPAVRAAVEMAPRILTSTCVVGTVVGSQLLLLVVLASGLSLGEAAQLHALVSLGAAGLLGLWLSGAAVGYEAPRAGAVCLGLAAAATTAFVLLSGVVHFSYVGEHVLPLAERLSDLLSA
jgi:hypothetical protein